MNKQFSANTPVWMPALLRQNEIHDETKFVNLGFAVERLATSMELKELASSAWINYPTLYKFIGV